MTSNTPNPNTESERVPNTAATAIPRPETYVLANANSALVWQVSRFPNGSLHLAFSADERPHKDCVAHMRQFADDEIVYTPGNDHVIRGAELRAYAHGLRTFYHVVYRFEKIVVERDENDEIVINPDTKKPVITRLEFYISEFDLLDYDNPREYHANVVTRAYDYWYQRGNLLAPSFEKQLTDLDTPNREDK